MAKATLHCSFCGRSRDEVKILIAGQEGHICENCVEHAREIIDQELMIRNDGGTPGSQFKLNVKKPMEVKRFLDEYVIGQDEAKRILAVAVYNHYKRLQQKPADTEIEIEKSNQSWMQLYLLKQGMLGKMLKVFLRVCCRFVIMMFQQQKKELFILMK
jgi:ATP-dependent Clp protease ATP-binding subunit ClpX